MSLDEVRAKKDRREKQRTETAGAERDKNKYEKPKTDTVSDESDVSKDDISDESDVSKDGISDESDVRSDKVCFQFQANGSWNYGESCRFEHTDWAHIRTQLSGHPASLDETGKIRQETNDCNSGVSYSAPPLQSGSNWL